MGDGCHAGRGGGAYYELVFETFRRRVAPVNGAVNLATTSDCDLPHRDAYRGRAESYTSPRCRVAAMPRRYDAAPPRRRVATIPCRRDAVSLRCRAATGDLEVRRTPCRYEDAGYGNATALLDGGRVVWWATNPSDHLHAPHERLKALPIGVLDSLAYGRLLDGREVNADRPTTLACCCMASMPPFDRQNATEARGLPRPRLYGRRPGAASTIFSSARLLAPDALRWRYNQGETIGDDFTRARRFAVVERLVANGFENCRHGADASHRKEDKLKHWVQTLSEADFVASPQGKGRANHREWEAMAAGAIPLVDRPSGIETCLDRLRGNRGDAADAALIVRGGSSAGNRLRVDRPHRSIGTPPPRWPSSTTGSP